ncbi:40S ribosomal protein S29 [Phytophthora pseudosyringae]|uniref:40S ribosomal protein S29 n=1 Tax=Phytophthora pseudosyringae TaxID=221518 RepID=A0A8T1VQ88_9STRA|nr:40S ribosomal protein S29 [Phytophthora pseudosyringae]
MANLTYSHPRNYGKDSRHCRVCKTTRGLIRKYHLNMCRRCFRERANDIGFIKHSYGWNTSTRCSQSGTILSQPLSLESPTQMNGQTARAAVLAVVVSVCASAAIVATADKHSLRAPWLTAVAAADSIVAACVPVPATGAADAGAVIPNAALESAKASMSEGFSAARLRNTNAEVEAAVSDANLSSLWLAREPLGQDLEHRTTGAGTLGGFAPENLTRQKHFSRKICTLT